MSVAMNDTAPSSPAAAVSPEDSSHTSLELSREILKEVAKLYSPPEHQTVASTKGGKFRLSGSQAPRGGLRAIGQIVNQPVSMSHQKAAIMVIGNISAGKSTFINWYVHEAVQKTGMAIETSGFTYITSGRCVTEIGGESAVTLRPQLRKLAEKYKGFLANLSLKTCPSYEGGLQLVDLIDTPGLADGELQYPFDIEEVVVEMRHYVDLFFVFFDPIGQALGRRMLSVIKRLYDACPDKVRFCLTKIDDIRTEEERIKVMCQTTQSLTAKISSRHAFDLIPIFIPGAKEGTYLSPPRDDGSECQIVNRLHDLVDDIGRVTERRVQDALHNLFDDVTKLGHAVDRRLEKHAAIELKRTQQASLYWRRMILRWVVVVLAAFFGLVHLQAMGDVSSLPKLAQKAFDLVDEWTPPEMLRETSRIARHVQKVPFLLHSGWGILAALFLLTVQFKSSEQPTTSHAEYARLLDAKEYLATAHLRWKQLNRRYLDHAMQDPPSDSNNSTDI